MEVFDTLPSMYTVKKWEELKAKKRSELNFEHLYWLSRFAPTNQDGHHLNKLIDSKIDALRTNLFDHVNPLKDSIRQVNGKMT